MLCFLYTQRIESSESYGLPYRSARSRSLCPRRGQARWISPWPPTMSVSWIRTSRTAQLPGRKWNVRRDGWIYICRSTGVRKKQVIAFTVLRHVPAHTRDLSSKNTKRCMPAQDNKQSTNRRCKSNQQTRNNTLDESKAARAHMQRNQMRFLLWRFEASLYMVFT